MDTKITQESAAVRNLRGRKSKDFKYRLVLEGVAIGLVTGIIISIFRMMLVAADALRGKLVDYAHAGAVPAAVTAVILAAVAVLVVLLLRAEPDIGGSGIPQVEAEVRGQKDMNWWRVIVCKMTGCALAIGGGLALGREGPSIQLGAMVGKGFSRLNHRLLTEERLLITCGAGSGLSAAFGAPLAGAIFSLEELHRNFSAEVLLSSMAASVTSQFVAGLIVGTTPVFGFDVDHSLPLRYYWAVVLLGVLTGVCGIFYNKTIAFMQRLFDRFRKPLYRILAMFAVSYILIFVYPTALGSGGSLVGEISHGRYALAALAVLLLVKFAFSTASFGSGAPGGIFLPLLVLGAVTGGLFSRLLGLAGLDQRYITAFVVIAMAGYFAAIVRAPVTGVVLITEMTGDFTSLLPLVMVSLIACVIADRAGSDPIYTQLLKRSEQRTRYPAVNARMRDRKTILDADVHTGSYMDGRPIADFGLPIGALIVSVDRGGAEIIPDGHTILRAGDELEILTREQDVADVESLVEARCHTIVSM